MKYLLALIAIVFTLNSFSQESENLKVTEESQETSNLENSAESEEVSFAIIEQVPIYKGCSKNLDNRAQKSCFNEKINKHIGRNFNINVAQNIDVPHETEVRIAVMFKISDTGTIIDIQAKTEYPELEAEAIRVIKLIPPLEPGYFKDKPVTVPYYLPIKFKIAKNTTDTSNMQFPTYKGCEDSVSFEDLKNCTINKITDYVKVSVNYELADALFPLEKSTQFQVSFIINEKGKAEDISAKAHKREMAAEAIRILKRMPKMKKPGYVNGKSSKFPVDFLMTIYF